MDLVFLRQCAQYLALRMPTKHPRQESVCWLAFLLAEGKVLAFKRGEHC